MRYFVYAKTVPSKSGDEPKLVGLAIAAEDGRELEVNAADKGAEEQLAEFVKAGHGKAEIWLYDADVHWPLVRDLIGSGKSHKDITARAQELGSPTLPALPSGALAENASAGARWTRDAWVFLDRYAGQAAPESEEVEEEEEPPHTTKKPSRKK